MIFIIILFLITLYWLTRKWSNDYYHGVDFLDRKKYLNHNIFWYMPRKIYRPGKITKKEYDIFILTKADRLRKRNNYILSNMSDNPIIKDEL